MVILRFLTIFLLSVFSFFTFGKDLVLSWSISENEKNLWLSGSESTNPEGPILSFKLVLPLDYPDPKIVEKEINFIKLDECPQGLSPSKEKFVWGAKGIFKGIPYRELLVFPLVQDDEGNIILLSSFEIELSKVNSISSTNFAYGDCGSIEYKENFVNYWEICKYYSSNVSQSGVLSFNSLPQATTPIYRVSVNQDGIIKLTKNYLDSLGINFSSVDPRKIHLFSRGVEIPLYVQGEEDGVFNDGDSIIFYGQKLSIKNRAVWNGGDFTDTNVYFLYADENNGLRMDVLDVSPVNPAFPVTTTFYSNLTFEVNNQMSWADHLRPNGELWFWAPGLYYVAGLGEKNRSIPLTLPHPVLNGDSFSLQIVEAGFNNISHILDAKINSSSYQRQTFSGKTISNLNYSFLQNQLNSSGSNTLTIRIPSSQTVNDNQIVDTISVNYLRTTDADSDSLMIEDEGGNKRYIANGFSIQPLIFDLSNKDAQTDLFIPKRCENASFSSGQITFDYSDTGTARKCFLSSNAFLPLSIEQIESRNLQDSNLGCKFMILTHPDFHPSGSDQEWQNYLSRKSSQFNGDVLWIDIQEIYDNFSYGIFDPTAIKTFLTFAKNNWQEFPSYLLLIGDGSYDYKNYLGDPTFKNWVPSMMIEDVSDSSHQGWMASDSYFGDTDNDGYPNLSIGRIPVRTYAEFAGVLNKIIAYEDQTVLPNWRKTQFFVADTYDESWEEEFETFNNNLKNTFAVSPYQSLKVYYHDPPYNGTDQDLCASQIRNYWDDAVLVHYAGHSGARFWGYINGILSLTAARGSDLENLPTISSPNAPLPFVVNSTCYITGFAYQGGNSPALFEAFLNASDRGVIGSTGYTTISYLNEDEAFTTPFFNSLFGVSKKRTIGDVVESARFAIPSANSRPVLSLVLLGDPTTKILLPDVPKPLSLSADAGNQSATLNWQHPSVAPYGYNIYRSLDGTTFSKINSSLVLYPSSSYSDSGLTNGTTYYYYVTSVDSEGFESASSNIAQATPTNPNPPAAPTGLRVVDLGLGDSLKISWNANSETDLSYYKLYWGTSSNVYTNSQTYPKTTTSTTISGLSTNVNYYFALTATNSSGKESAYSNEAIGKPTNYPVAVRIPAMITDLKVERSGNDLILKWTKPQVDIKGDPITVVSFDIYRIVNQFNYNLDTVNLAYPNAKINVGAVEGENTYTDSGAVNLGNIVTYLVVAKDSNGNRSSASHQPPSPVMTLRIQKSETTGATLIFFDPVTTTIDGKQTNLITNYKLYGFYPITSSKDHISPSNAVSPLNPMLLSVPLPSCEEGAVYCDSSTSPPLFYTVVAVDNRGNTSLY
ncbi:MAG: C25 family cysteine peptidase [Acidobacteriota bacterium]